MKDIYKIILIFIGLFILVQIIGGGDYNSPSFGNQNNLTNQTNRSYIHCWPKNIKTDNNKILTNILDSSGYEKKKEIHDNWRLFLPITFKNSNQQIKDLVVQNGSQIIGLLENNYLIGTKKYLWKSLLDSYGRDQASKIMPSSYIFPKDTAEFKRDYQKSGSKSKLFMLKKEKHRQEGLKISNNYSEIIDCHNQGYSVVQKYLTDSYLFQGHKINLRLYLLLTAKGNRFQGYLFPDGIVSYTPQQNNDNYLANFGNETDPGYGITSFYDSKPLYDQGYPIIISELLNKDPTLRRRWNSLFDKFRDQLSLILKSLEYKMVGNSHYPNNLSYQLFGVDYFLDKDLEHPRIVEINIGPGMIPHCSRDGYVRTQLQIQICNVLGLISPHQINQINQGHGHDLKFQRI